MKGRLKHLCMTAALAMGTLLSPLTTQADDSCLEITAISATSTLPSSDYGTYGPENLLDGYLSTAWVENACGLGAGEGFTCTVSPGAVLTGVVIYPGYLKNSDIFYKNAAPVTMTCEAGDTIVTLYMAEFVSDYDTASLGITYRFDPIEVDDGRVTFKIGQTRYGSAYEDTCISEIGLLGYQANYGYPKADEISSATKKTSK